MRMATVSAWACHLVELGTLARLGAPTQMLLWDPFVNRRGGENGRAGRADPTGC